MTLPTNRASGPRMIFTQARRVKLATTNPRREGVLLPFPRRDVPLFPNFRD